MQLTSPVFVNGGIIPEAYAFSGKNRNPPLVISVIPAQTASLVIIMHDQMAGKDMISCTGLCGTCLKTLQ
jgi:phosphatidylethanolamine-binding protein (PEBP) family uncharacterized protein